MKSWNKNTVLHILKIVLAIGLIYWLVHRGTLDLQAMKVIFTPVYLVSCFGLMLVMMLLGHLRWFFLLRSRSFAVSFWHTLPLTFIGLFFNFTMPGSVGGDFVKGYYVTRDHPQRKMEAAVTVMMDRIVGLFAMMVMAVVSIVFS